MRQQEELDGEYLTTCLQTKNEQGALIFVHVSLASSWSRVKAVVTIETSSLVRAEHIGMEARF